MNETLCRSTHCTRLCPSSAMALHGYDPSISSSSTPMDVRGTASAVSGIIACFQQASSLIQSCNLDMAHVWQRVSQEDFLALLAAICPGGKVDEAPPQKMPLSVPAHYWHLRSHSNMPTLEKILRPFALWNRQTWCCNHYKGAQQGWEQSLQYHGELSLIFKDSYKYMAFGVLERVYQRC